MKNYKTKVCKRCGKEFKPINDNQKYCSGCRIIEHREYTKQWKKNHPEKEREYNKNQYKKVRISVLNIISNGNPRCVRCGCDDINLLEINHKNGGGQKEFDKENTQNFYRKIYKRVRKIDDLELLCKVCNAWHALELKYGKLPYKVIYNKKLLHGHAVIKEGEK